MSQLVVIEMDELLSMIKKAVADGLTENTPYPSPTAINPNLMTRKQAAKYLGVSPNTVTLYNRQGKISAAVINGQYRFFESDLLKYLNKTKA